MNPLVILPHAKIPSNTTAYKQTDAKLAINQTHNTDAHALAYFFADGSPTPRLRLGDLSDLIDAKREPLLGYVFVDVDNEGHKKWTADAAEWHWSQIKTKPALKNAGFYSTRGGYRLVFELKNPIKVSVASHFIEQFYEHLRGAGVPVDPHCNARWNTLFRLPRVTRDGALLEAFVDLDAMRPMVWEPPVPLQSKVAPKNSIHAQHERPELKPLTDLGWGMIANCGDFVASKIERLKAGEPIAKSGARQATMFKLAATIIGKLELDEPNLAYQALAPSVIASGLKGSKITLDGLWDRCCYLVAIDQSKREARAQIKEVVASNQPPIVYHGSAYYVRDVGAESYRPPVPGPALCQALEQWCTLPGMETRTPNQKPRALAEYLAEYGRQAVEVIVEMGRKKAVYHSEMAGGTLLDGCCVPIPLQAEENQDVAEWLKHFAGAHHEKLLDWIATVARLDRPTCALYIEGPPGTGKGLFSSGIAALWGSGATSYADATGKFNAALTRNPVVLVDEMFQAFDGGDGFSGGFRTLIGESTRQLRRKNLPSSTLRGCPRLIIAANNAHALKLTENLGQDDLLAIAERILHVKHDTSPRDYVNFMGGRDFTEGWVLDKHGRPGAIAKHARWLAENRKVKTGSRFLVQGEISDWHRDLMGNSGLQGATLAALAHFIDRARPAEGIQIDGRFIYVNAPALRGLWGLLMGDQPPREGALAGALKTLAGGVQKRRDFSGSRLRCYQLELQHVIRRAESLQIGDVEQFENLLTRKALTNDQHTEA